MNAVTTISYADAVPQAKLCARSLHDLGPRLLWRLWAQSDRDCLPGNLGQLLPVPPSADPGGAVAQWVFCCLRKSARQLPQSSRPDSLASSMVR